MLGGDIFILETIGFLIGEIDEPLHAGCDKDLTRASHAKDGDLGRVPQRGIQALHKGVGVRIQFFNDLDDRAPGLLYQGQQDMFRIHLIVPIVLYQLGCPLSSFSCTFGKSFKLHHLLCPFIKFKRAMTIL